MRNDVRYRRRRDETKIRGARRGPERMRTIGVIARVQIDFLIAKFQCRAIVAEDNRFHPQNGDIEVASDADIGNGQNNVVKAIEP